MATYDNDDAEQAAQRATDATAYSHAAAARAQLASRQSDESRQRSEASRDRLTGQRQP